MSSPAKRDTKTFVPGALLAKTRDCSNATEFSFPRSVSLKLLTFQQHIQNESTQDRKNRGHGLVRLRQLRSAANGGS